MATDILNHFAVLKKDSEYLNLYALVDGLAYEAHTSERIVAGFTHRSLFEGTPDAPLAHAGAWVVDVAKAPNQIPSLGALEQALPAVAWLITAMDLDEIVQFLKLQQDMQTADGHVALLRIADPRVMVKLNQVMTIEQKQSFFGLIEEWHLFHDGKRVRLGGINA